MRRAQRDGRLVALCHEQGLELLVLFGSAVSDEEPGDVDLAVAWCAAHQRDLLGVVVALMELVGDSVDVMDLDRAGPVARQRALTRGEVLVELTPHAFAERQIHAMREFLDTQRFRDQQLRIYAG